MRKHKNVYANSCMCALWKRSSQNKKLKHSNQRYCGDKICQSARKLSFEREKYKTNCSFRSDKPRRANERNKSHADPGDPKVHSQYQLDYRALYPDYVANNREKQRDRNARKAGKTSHKKKIVNPDAFISQIDDIELVINDPPMFVRLL